MHNCTFCKIINGSLPSYKIYEDLDVIVFLDIKPTSDGHTLIVPKKHFVDFEDIDIETLNKINAVAKRIYVLLKEKLNPDGIQIVQNNGSISEIKHFSIHLIPKFKYINARFSLPTLYKMLIIKDTIHVVNK